MGNRTRPFCIFTFCALLLFSLFSIATAHAADFVRLLGTSSDDHGRGIAVDSSGNSFVTGTTQGNLYGQTNSGSGDIFVAKYDSSGTRQWVRLLGTSSDDWGQRIAVDSSGNSYVTGYSGGNLDGQTNSGGFDIFVAKYDSSGTRQWVRLLGTSGSDSSYGIALDSSGNSYVTGYSGGNLDGQTNSGNRDIFVAKYDSSGTRQWVRLLGTSGDDNGYGIAVDSSGNSYVTGYSPGNLADYTGSGYY